MVVNPYIKKLGLRFLVINIVFLAIKLFVEKDPNESYINNTTIFYYVSAFILFMLSWEINDWFVKLIKRNKTKNELLAHSYILILTVIPVMIVAAIIYYLGIFEFTSFCKIATDNNPWQVFKLDMFRALGLVVVFSLFNQFYWISKDKKDLELSILELKKEMMTSRFTSLKSQISPHFLFNSLNTLTSLMYEDRDLASDFVSRLASCYRYILDQRENDLVRLDKELQFLDSFIFMMKVRHNDAIQINIDIPKAYHSYLIPTLSIQMLVENALKHNYYTKEHPIIIKISAKNDIISVVNNKRKRTDSQESTQLGLNNIKKRYAFYTAAPMTIKDSDESFSVEMPLLLPSKIEKSLETTLIT